MIPRYFAAERARDRDNRVLLRRVPLRVELVRLGDEVLMPRPPVELGARLLARDLLVEGQRIGERAHLRPRLLDGLDRDLTLSRSAAAGLGDLAQRVGGCIGGVEDRSGGSALDE